MAGTLAPLALVLSPTSDTGIPLDGLTRRNGVDVDIVGLNLLGGPITIFDDRDGNGVAGPGEILTTVPNSILGSVRLNLPEGTHNLRATQNVTVLGITTTTTSLALPVRIDNTAPTIVSVNQLDLPDPLGLLDLVGVLRYEVTFSEPVIGLTADLFQATGTLPGVHLVTLIPVSGDLTRYIVSIGLGLDGVSADQRAGTLGLALNPSNLSGVTDIAGNGLRGADFALIAPVNIGPARETATADFNADGLGDAAFLVNNTVVVTRGTGTGALGTTQTVSVATGQTTIAAGDVTGDGRVDIVTAGNGLVEILKQNADGTFTLTNRTTPGADGALIADVNGDGYADIVVKNLAAGTATVLTNNGTGSFSAGSAQTLTVRPDALVSGDFNGDGRIDLAALANGGTTLALLTQTPTGTFVRSTLAVGASAGGLAAGDLNGDGRAEIVSAGAAGTLEIRGFTAGGAVTQSTLQAGAAATDIRIGDTNGDGHQDILYAGTDGNVRVVYGDGSGGFSAPVVLETQAGLTALALLDINGDGRQDLALASGTTGTLQVGTGIPLAGVLGTVYDIVAPAPVHTVTSVTVAGDNVVNIAEAAAGTVGVSGTLSGPLGAGETLAIQAGGVVTTLPGATVVTANGVTSFTATIPAPQASGDLVLLVQRTDGETSAPLTQAFTVDLVAPTLASVVSLDGPVTNDTSLEFTATFSEPVSGLTAANFGFTGAASGLVPTITPMSGGLSYMISVASPATEGTLGLTFNSGGVVDAAGNPLPGAGTFVPVGTAVTLDFTAPVLTLDPVAGDGVLSSVDLAAGVVLSGSAGGLAAGATVMVTITDAQGTPVLTTTAPVANGAFSLPLTGLVGNVLTDGSYVVAVSAMDAAGNVAVTAVANLTVDVTVDSGAAFRIVADTGPIVGIAGSAAVPLVVTGLDSGATAIVTFTDGDTSVTAALGLNGRSTVDLSGLDGTVTSSVRITDVAGNTGILPGPTLSLDTVAPVGLVAPGVLQPAGTVTFDVAFGEPVTGLDASDFAIVGTGGIVGSVVQATPNQSGGYTIVVGNLSGTGTLGLALSGTSNIVDTAGNAASLLPPVPVAVDLVPPSTPVITGLASDIDLTVPVGFQTADSTPTLVGTAEAGSLVTVSTTIGGTPLVLTTTAGPSGAWTVTVPTVLADGSYAFTATATDLAGNVSQATLPKLVTVESATGIPFSLAVAFDDGLVNRAEAGAITYTLTDLPADAVLTVTFTDAQNATVTTQLDPAGGTLNLSGLNGPVTSTVTYAPAVGPAVILTGPGATFDTIDPTTPTILGFAAGGAATSTSTGDTTPVLVGTGEIGSIVSVVVGGQTLTAEVDATGTWHIPVSTPLSEQTVTLTATARDAAGNQSGVSAGLAVTVDLTADAGAPVTVALAIPADRLLTPAEAAAITGTVSGIDPDATATLVFTSPGGTVSVPLANGTGVAADLSGLAGAVTASVSVVDAVGNTATIAVPGFFIDAVAPAATIVADPAAGPGATSLTFTVTFPETVANLTPDDFVLVRTGTAAGTVTTAIGTGGTYVVTVDGITGTGAISLGLAPGSNIADVAGNLAVVASAGTHPVNVPIVVQPQDLPVITSISVDTGLAGDFVTSDRDPAVTGTALANGTVTLTYTDSTGVSASVTTQADTTGAWSVALPSLGDGTYTLSAKLTDASNNVLGVSANFPLVIDTVLDSGAPVALAVAATANGAIDAAEAVAVSYTVTGLDAGSSATVRFTDGDLVKEASVAADGTFAIDLSGLDGQVTTSLIVRDLAGNTGTILGNVVRVDTDPTAAPGVTVLTTDTGVGGDGVTNDTTPTLTGTAEAGATVLVSLAGPNGVQTVQAVADGTGAWTVTTPILADAVYTVTTTATGASGVTSPASSPFVLTIDTSADLSPLVGLQLASSDILLSAPEAASVSFALTGLDTGTSGTVSFTDGSTVVSVPVAANGTYTANLSALSGPVTASATVSDAAGNAVTADLALPAGFSVDTIAPQGSAVADISGGSAVSAFTYAVTFPEPVNGVTLDDFVLTGTAGATGQIASVTGSAGNYVVTVTGVQGTGTLSLGLAPGSDIADLAGNLAALTPGIRAVVGVAPVEPVILGFSDDTGATGDSITSDTTPTLSGIGQAGSTVTIDFVTANGAQSVTGVVSGTGTWSVDIPTLADGNYSFTARLTAPDGSPIGTSQPLAITVDATADGGAPTTLAVATTADGIIQASEAAAVSFAVAGLDSGTAAIVRFTDGTHILDVSVAANGTYAADLSGFDGTVRSSLVLTDVAGNTATVTGNDATVFTLRPGTPVIGGIDTDSGAPGDGITTDTTPTVTGSADIGSVVHVSYGTPAGVQVVDVLVGPTGTWSAQLPQLVDGTYAVTATATGPSGLDSAPTAPFSLTVDTTLDAAPAVALAPAAGNSGPFDATESAAVTVVVSGLDAGTTGTALFTDGTNQVSVAVTGNGPVVADLSSLNGTVTATLALTDPAGNAGSVQTGLSLAIDTVAPLGSATADLSGGPSVASFTYAVSFAEDVANVSAADFLLTGTNGVTGQIASVTGSAGNYVVTVSGIQGSGTLSLGLAPGSDIADIAGNLATLTPGTRDVTGVPPVQPAILAFSQDTGVNGDFVTSDTTPTLSGIGLAAGTVFIEFTTAAGAQSIAATVDPSGAWSVDVPALADGTYAFVARLTDAGGAPVGSSAPLTLTIDTQADGGSPAALSVDPAGDGVLNANETAAVAYTVAGLDADATGTVTFRDATHVVAVAVAGNGAFTADLSGFSGEVTSTLAIQDAAGNVVTRVGTPIAIDASGPPAPVIVGITEDSGTAGDGITNDATPLLSGTAEPGSTIHVTFTTSAGAQAIDAPVGPGGSWSVQIPTLADGSYAFTATAIDAAGNAGTPSQAFQVVIDTNADAAPSATLAVTPSDDGRLNAAEAAAASFVVAGLDPGTSGTAVFSDGSHSVTVSVGGNGSYTVNLSTLDGPITTTLSLADAAGNAATVAGSGPIVDAIAPAGTATPDTQGGPAAGTFTYAVNFPETVVNVTADDFVLAGTNGASGRVSAVTAVGGGYLVTVTDVSGTGSLSIGLASGSDITDLAGNSATLSATPRAVAVGGNPQPMPTTITGFSDDTGIAGDRITSDTTPILSGSAAAGATVTVTYVEAGTIKAVPVIVDGNGHWTAAIPALSDGTYSFSASAVGADGVPTGTSTPLTLTIDTVADAAPVVSLVVDEPAGGVLTPAQAAAVSFMVAGLDAGSAAAVTFTDGTNTVRVDAGADGTYTADLSTLSGNVTSSFVVSDVAGNSAAGTGNGVVISPVVPPSLVTPTVTGIQADSGIPGDGITNDTSPTVMGTGTPGSTVTVTYVDQAGPHTVTVPVGSDGAWRADLPTLPDGTYDVVATGRDASGQTTPAGQPFRVVIDTVADTGTPVSLNVEPTRDGVVNAEEALDSAYTVAGLDAGSSAAVTFSDGTHSVTTQVTGNGRYAVDLTSLNGTVTSTILATDAAGNGASAVGNAVRLDTLAPAAPLVTGFTDDTGIVGNGKTADTTPTLLGTAEAGSTVSIAYDTPQGPRTATVVAGMDGHWSLDLPTLPEGSYAFVASATDAAGNRSPASTAFGLTIDPRDVGDGGGTGGDGSGGTGNLAPRPVADAIATATHADAVTGNVLANDSDPNAGDVLHVTSVRFANGVTVAVPTEGTATVVSDHGTLHMAADGSYSYQAIGSNNFLNGGQVPEGFTYTVSDGKGLSASAGLVVSVQGVAPAAEATFGFAFTDAKVELVGESLVLTGPDGIHHDVSGIGTLHFTDGSIQENDGHPLVDDVWYLSHNLDVWRAHVDADTHYETFGWHEGRDPNAYFRTQEYLAENPDVAAAGVNPLEHYATYGEHEGRSPGDHFSPEAYLAMNPDVKAAGVNALGHYLGFGQAEGRTIQDGESPFTNTGAFDPDFYLTHNPDVADVAAKAASSGVSQSDFAFRHYLDYGANEGRAPSALFDPSFYLANNPDVAAAGVNPLIHYEEYGWREGRNPGPGFDTNHYLEANPDVAAAGIDPLQHYLEFGLKEGRMPT